MLQRKCTTFMLFLILFCLSANGLLAQDKKQTPKKQYKEFMKLQDSRDDEKEEKMDSKRKKHMDIQTKQTKKRMKQQQRRSARISKGKHPDTFFQRITKKQPAGR